jgi:hypothetical protein
MAVLAKGRQYVGTGGHDFHAHRLRRGMFSEKAQKFHRLAAVLYGTTNHKRGRKVDSNRFNSNSNSNTGEGTSQEVKRNKKQVP